MTRYEVRTRADYDALPPAIQASVRAEARAHRQRRSFGWCLEQRGIRLSAWQGQLAEVLESVAHDAMSGHGRNVILEAPPQVGKSWLIVSQWIPWWLRLYPQARSIVVGHDQSLVRRLSQDGQDAYVEWAPTFGRDGKGRTWTSDEWTTDSGGRVLTRGVGGNVTGGGYVVGVADDLISIGDTGRAAKDLAWRVFRRQLLSRRNIGAATVLMAHRVADDDVTGRWKKHNDENDIPYEVHTWRMVAEEDEGWRDAGDLLCPERVGWDIVREAQADPWFYSTTYQQRPTKEGGAVIQEAWTAHRYPGRPEDVRRTCSAVYIVIDPAAKTAERNDPSAIGVLGVCGGDVMVLHVEAERRDYPALRQRVRDLSTAWRASGVLVEDTSVGQALVPDLRAMGLACHAVGVAGKGDKVARMQPHLIRWQSGQIKLPESAPWVASFVGEVCAVPDAAHDDQWDMMSIGLSYLAGLSLAVVRPFRVSGV
jgi:predicted phage terminase large subunit-like protein